MASESIKPSKKKLQCTIINIEPDPKHPGRQIIAVRFDDGDPRGPWIQGFSILPEKVISIDDFMDHLMNQKLERPDDPYKELKKYQESGEPFVLNLTGKIVGGDNNGD